LDLNAHLDYLNSLSPIVFLKQEIVKGELYLVGGACRELFRPFPKVGDILGDFDFATNLTPDVLIALGNERGFRVIPTGMRHGTVTILTPEPVEVTTYRLPQEKHEEVNSFASSILDDLSGRDFTINALAFDFKNGILLDPFSGLKDLKDGRLKAVGDPSSRFAEDPLRILRAYRFGPAANRLLDESTREGILSERGKLVGVSAERIRDEFNRILLSEKAREALEMMMIDEVLQLIIPEVIPSIGCQQNRFHIEDVFAHTLSVISNVSSLPLNEEEERLTLLLTAFFHDLGKPHTLSIGEHGERHFYEHEVISESIAVTVMTRLRYPTSMIKRVALLVGYHMRPMTCGLPGLRRLLRDLADDFPLWRAFKEADRTPAFTLESFYEMADNFDRLLFEEQARTKNQKFHLAVSGHDLIRIGFKPGPRLGEVLKALEELTIEDPSWNEREFLLERAKSYL
jgi:tRNA nucleotidyltransferase (CCA-adding enzyme)